MWYHVVSIHVKIQTLNPLSKWFMVVGTNNLTIEHDTAELITPYFTQNQLHIFNNIIISCCEEIPKIGENPLIIDLAF